MLSLAEFESRALKPYVLRVVTHRDRFSSSSLSASSFTRFLGIGAKRLFRTDVDEASASFKPAAAFLTSGSVTSALFDLMNYTQV